MGNENKAEAVRVSKPAGLPERRPGALPCESCLWQTCQLKGRGLMRFSPSPLLEGLEVLTLPALATAITSPNVQARSQLHRGSGERGGTHPTAE